MLNPRALACAPFSKENQLCQDLDHTQQSSGVSHVPSMSLPGQPNIRLNSDQLKEFLKREFWADDIETMAPHLWIMTTPSSTNINPLHRQRIRGREIVVTEDPRLHLVWVHDKIFLKPLPAYLMSHTFWMTLLLDDSSSLKVHRDMIKRAALGYLRTYASLIRHESDFVIAQRENLRLVPSNITWTQYCHFTSAFSEIRDSDVSGRYHYGELRLTRLNFYVKFFLRKFYYEQIHGQYGDYFARLYGPVLFIFAIVTTVLNSMQVELAAEEVLSKPSRSLGLTSSWFSRISLLGTAVAALCFLILWLWMFLDEWIYTLKWKPWRRDIWHEKASF